MYKVQHVWIGWPKYDNWYTIGVTNCVFQACHWAEIYKQKGFEVRIVGL